MLKSSKTERFSRRNASIAFRPNGRKLSYAKEAELVHLAISKLGSSGLSLEDARQLGIEVAGGTLISELHPSFHPIAALKINYFDLDGSPLSDIKGAPPFYRIRYLKTLTGLEDLVTKPQRYAQIPNTLPLAYFPRGYFDWTELSIDTSQPLIITEGELKAACACKYGFPTIGLGGVYNWRSYKMGIMFLPILERIDWQRRNIYICFDSDYRSNPMVLQALQDLAMELSDRGAYINIVSLPDVEGLDKVGLDDYIVAMGKTGVSQFQNLLHEAEPWGLTGPLWDYNNRYIYIRNPGVIVSLDNLAHKIAPTAFKEHLETAAKYPERVLKPDGTVSYKPINASAQWLRWGQRHEAAELTYQPGGERYLRNKNYHRPVLNTWAGWGISPIKGSVRPFKQLLGHLFTGAEPEALEWFIKWMAYPLQHPGTKLFTAAVIHGIKHGTGKSLIGYTLAHIYGKNFTEISQADIHATFNEWAESKQFVMGDDVTGSNKRQDSDFLKKMITQKELRVNMKYVPSYTVPDCINYLFTSNHPDSFFLEDDDRRFFIHEVIVPPLEEKFYRKYMKWLDNGGAAHVFDWLLSMNLKGFNPSAPAYKTVAKERMIDAGRSDLAAWVRQLMVAPDQVLRIGSRPFERDIATAAQLLSYYDPEEKTAVTANGLARELSRAGFRQANGGRPVKLPSGSQLRYYIVRNQDLWMDAPHSSLIEHLEHGWMPVKRSRRDARGRPSRQAASLEDLARDEALKESRPRKRRARR